MSARDYPITFAYGAQDGKYYGPNGSVGAFHRGDDYACPSGTPIVIGSTTIGNTGATGLVSGPHLHIQEWQGSTSNTRKPQNSFKGGRVAGVGTGTAWGKYVTIESGGWYTTYAHLSSQAVKVGQTIGGDDMITKQSLDFIFQQLLGRLPDPGAYAHYVGNYTTDFVITDVSGSQERKNVIASQKAVETARAKELSTAQTRISTLERQVSGLQEQVKGLLNELKTLKEQIELSEKSRGVLTEANQKLIRQLDDLGINHDQEIKDLKEDHERDLDEAATECAAKIEAAKNQTPPKGSLFETPQTWKQWFYVTINFIRGLRR